ncbi:protein AUXIN RESPONSE 4 [Phalaenopsis equestris]|uniref:protein AUXIN RESPONSE 4 n=1 Tax=Phalaenopsis equestris TaxID=78828 RepID=UPI0009E5241F|nr:protein AUXIN RESPONSE 4 [Phalaenopsis equestris]
MAETEKKREGGEIAPELTGESSKAASTSKPSSSGGPATVFAFWFYFTVAVSLITLLFISLPRIERKDDLSWFLTLPDGLRSHYSAGKLIKVNPIGGGEPMQVFAVELGKKDAETVLLVHGLGCSSYSFRRVLHSLAAGGLRTVAIDVPGSSFSDELSLVNNAKRGDPLGWIWNIFAEIKEKGFFWGFDQLIETGEIRERPAMVSSRKESEYGSEMMGAILGQVIDSMALAPVHLVLHDSALIAGTNWVSANAGLVSSLTLIDSSPMSAAFPSPLLRLPVLGHLLLGSKTLFAGLLRLCCARSIDIVDSEAYRLVLKRKNRRSAALAIWRALNHSLDVGEWINSEEVKGLPVQLLWSNTLSDQWIDEGRRIDASILRAKFLFHSGGRWPQEDAAEEISEMIANFVSSLPKSIRRIEENTVPDHIRKFLKKKGIKINITIMIITMGMAMAVTMDWVTWECMDTATDGEFDIYY